MSFVWKRVKHVLVCLTVTFPYLHRLHWLILLMFPLAMNLHFSSTVPQNSCLPLWALLDSEILPSQQPQLMHPLPVPCSKNKDMVRKKLHKTQQNCIMDETKQFRGLQPYSTILPKNYMQIPTIHQNCSPKNASITPRQQN